MTTKAVFFDLEGTLIYRKKELVTEELCRILQDNNYIIYSQQFESAKRYVLFIEYPKGSIPDEKTLYTRIFQLLGHDVNEEVLKKIIDFSHENEVFEVFKDVKPCLKELSHRRYKMGIITSTPRFIFENILRKSSIFGYFKTIITSSEAGVPQT